MIALHSGKVGDSVFALAVLRHLGCKNLYVNAGWSGHEPPMGEALTRQLIELLRQQDYCQVNLWHGQEVSLELDNFRKYVDNPKRHLVDCHKLAAGLPENTKIDLSKWLYVQPKRVADVVVHRTLRYPGDVSFRWDSVLGLDAVFVGTVEEHRAVGMGLPHYRTDTLLEMAGVIAGARVLVCNQSVGLAIAEAVGVPYFCQANPSHPCAMPLTDRGSTSISIERLLESFN